MGPCKVVIYLDRVNPRAFVLMATTIPIYACVYTTDFLFAFKSLNVPIYVNLLFWALKIVQAQDVLRYIRFSMSDCPGPKTDSSAKVGNNLYKYQSQKPTANWKALLNFFPSLSTGRRPVSYGDTTNRRRSRTAKNDAIEVKLFITLAFLTSRAAGNKFKVLLFTNICGVSGKYRLVLNIGGT